MAAPDVSVSGSVAADDLRVQVTATVTNTGSRPGAEVVQVYVTDTESSVTRPTAGAEGLRADRAGAGRLR